LRPRRILNRPLNFKNFACEKAGVQVMEIQNIQDYAKAINLSWRKTTESVLETARLCAEADKKLPHYKEKFFKDLDFSKATFSKLVKIGSVPRLQTDPVKALLPPNYTIVYKVAMLAEPDLQVAIKEASSLRGCYVAILTRGLKKRAGAITCRLRYSLHMSCGLFVALMMELDRKSISKQIRLLFKKFKEN
jgi:hypothetical protein